LKIGDSMFINLGINKELKIVRFGGDYRQMSESLADLETLVNESEDLYPGIDIWFNKKVIPGLKNKDRRAYVLYDNEKPVGEAIIRLGKDTKICSLRLKNEIQGHGIGYLLFSILAIEMRHHATHVHFTAPESLWITKNNFFNKLGFERLGIASDQYRLFEEEFVCGTSFDNFWKNAINNLPRAIENFTINGNSNDCDLVLSIKPEHANNIINGKKRVEIRRSFSTRWQNSKALLYSSSPQKHFVGEAIIGEVQSAAPQMIWDTWNTEIGCSSEEYFSYCKGSEKVYAVVFSEVNRFMHSIPKIQLETLISCELNAPQSYLEVKKEGPWPIALSLSSLLRAHLY
jgi:predicted transcriptional regulator